MTQNTTPDARPNDRPKVREFESSLPIALLRARAATMHKFKRHTDAVGLSQPQWRVIRALAVGEPLDVCTLAERCALLQPSVSRLLKPLVDRGLVETYAYEDSRRRLLTLTSKGLAVVDEVAEILEAIYGEIETAYGKEELQQLIGMLNRLREVVDQLPNLPPGRRHLGADRRSDVRD